MGMDFNNFAQLGRIRFGAPVKTLDGDLGVVSQAYIHSSQQIISHIGIDTGFLFRKKYTLPVEFLASATGNEVNLKISRDEVASKTQSPDNDLVLFDQHTIVSRGGRPVGLLRKIIFDPATYYLGYIVCDYDARRGQILVPSSLIGTISTQRISLTCPASELDKLPLLRDSEKIKDEINKALFEIPKLHIDLSTIYVEVVDGVVYLSGNTTTDSNKLMIGEIASGIKGVVAVDDNIFSDNDLVSEVALALTKDSDIGRFPVGVYADAGIVTLRGAVRSEEHIKKATDLTSNIPGAKQVYNDLKADPEARILPVMAGVTGGEDIIPDRPQDG